MTRRLGREACSGTAFRHRLGLVGLAVACLLAGLTAASAQSVLRIYTGGQLRHELMQQIVEGYTRNNPVVRVEIETGGATPELQQQYLSAVLATKDPAIDLVLIDVLRPAQWAAAQVIEPLDAYLGTEKDAVMARYLPASRAAGIVNGKVMALPYAADAQFLYYRKDLLEKYGLRPPRTWDELKLVAMAILEGEKNPALRGFEASGALVESTVCSYLVPLWGAGEELLAGGKPNLAGEAARRPFQLWADLKAAKVTPPNLAEIPTDRIRQDFQAGNLIFGMSWGYVWNRLQNDADSAVKGRVGIVPPPGFTAERPAGCLGGWQVAVTSFSKNKIEAAKLARFLSSPEVAKMQAILGAQLPVFTGVYADSEVLAAHPWFAEALPAMLAAKARPASPRYGEVSEILRANMSAYFAGTKSAEAALMDMSTRLGAIFR